MAEKKSGTSKKGTAKKTVAKAPKNSLNDTRVNALLIVIAILVAIIIFMVFERCL